MLKMSAAKPAGLVCNYLQMHFQDLGVRCIDIDTRASYLQVSDRAVTDGSATSRREELGSRNTLSWHILYAVSEPSWDVCGDTSIMPKATRK
jgi:hypothetical protein